MSPRPGPRKVAAGVRLLKELLAVVDELAAAEGVTRSVMLGRLVEEALRARGRV